MGLVYYIRAKPDFLGDSLQQLKGGLDYFMYIGVRIQYTWHIDSVEDQSTNKRGRIKLFQVTTGFNMGSLSPGFAFCLNYIFM